MTLRAACAIRVRQSGPVAQQPNERRALDSLHDTLPKPPLVSSIESHGRLYAREEFALQLQYRCPAVVTVRLFGSSVRGAARKRPIIIHESPCEDLLVIRTADAISPQCVFKHEVTGAEQATSALECHAIPLLKCLPDLWAFKNGRPKRFLDPSCNVIKYDVKGRFIRVSIERVPARPVGV